MEPYGGCGGGKGGRGHFREEYKEWDFGDNFEEEYKDIIALQGRQTRGRENREEDNDLGNIKVNKPPFLGKSDLDLEWEERMEMIFDCHNYSEAKNVKLVALEFGHYALQWWNNE